MTVRRHLAAVLLALPAAAAAQPGWHAEAGLGAVGLYLPGYRGADQYNVHAYPFPYVLFRSERLRVSRDGMLASLFTHADVTLAMSLAASLPGDRDGTPARSGMPDLLPTFEAGPSLDVRLGGRRGSDFFSQLRLPLRAVLATDLRRADMVGWVFHPHVRADWQMAGGNWTLVPRLGGGPVWATRRYHHYFYGVDDAFVTAERPRYEADAGYAGMRVSGSLTARQGPLRWGVFAVHDWMEGAAFRDSPLFREEHAAMLGVYVSYRLWDSGGAVEEAGEP